MCLHIDNSVILKKIRQPTILRIFLLDSVLKCFSQELAYLYVHYASSCTGIPFLLNFHGDPADHAAILICFLLKDSKCCASG